MIVVLSGGVGGARLCAGLVREYGPEQLLIAVNTGDDFDHWGLRICPDLDTVMYTLAGRIDEAQGWGLAGETWRTLETVTQTGGPDWFRLGDQDLATHIARTALLAQGQPLSQATDALFRHAGIAHRVTPVTDADHRTLVDTDAGLLSFQDYFVRLRCEPRFKGIRFDGPAPRPAPGLAAAMASDEVEAVIVCPSNPLLSIAPILAVEGVRQWLRERRFPVIAVSPFIAGDVVKGPAAKIFSELGMEVSTQGLMRWYDGLVDGWLVSPGDMESGAVAAAAAAAGSVRVRGHHILLRTGEQRGEVAREIRGWVADWGPE